MDVDFQFNAQGLSLALKLLENSVSKEDISNLAHSMPLHGIGPHAALEQLAPLILGGSTKLGAPSAFAHMDPPTPWITWATHLWNASLNQNLLHLATAPSAREIESRVIDWLSPFFGMQGGHITPGSTIANLTALWAARECAQIDTVILTDSAHLSIAKSAHILGLKIQKIAVDEYGLMDIRLLPEDLSRSALILTAGTTTAGLIDPLIVAGKAAWTHVDAAWGGALRLTKHQNLLAYIEQADSVSLSAHKWLFQPKESAIIFFKELEKANAAISFGATYLSSPNIGVLGSHGATATPLLATLLAWGQEGLAQRIECCYDMSIELASFITTCPQLQLFQMPSTGIVLWRPVDPKLFDAMYQALPVGSVSIANLTQGPWFRNVIANPNGDIQVLMRAIERAILSCTSAL